MAFPPNNVVALFSEVVSTPSACLGGHPKSICMFVHIDSDDSNPGYD